MPIGEREPRADKVEAVAELNQILSESSAVILTDYHGLDVKGISSLRKQLREAGSGYKVIKNNLFTLAAKDTTAVPLTEGLEGPTAMVYTSEDPVAAAKVLQEFGKTAKTLKVKSGIVDGVLYGAEQIDALAKIPPKQQLYAMVVGGLQGPIIGLVSTTQQLISQFVFTLQAVAEKKEAA